MQITISKETAKAVKVAILRIADVVTDGKLKDGSVDIEKCNESLNRLGITPQQFNNLAHLVYQIENKLNNNPKKK